MFLPCLTIFLSLFCFHATAHEKSAYTALRMVKGKIENTYEVYSMRTSKGSIVHITFDEKNALVNAEGENPEKDELFIGAMGFTLTEALANAKKEGIKPQSWEFQKENQIWTYLFSEKFPDGKEKLIKIDASNGKNIPL